MTRPHGPGSVRDSRVPHTTTCAWFWAWVLVGMTGALGLVSLGPLALIPALIAAAVLERKPTARRSAPGVLAGAGLLSLYVAYVQRDGPGTTCRHTVTGSGCNQHLSPIPWLIVGLALVTGAVVAQHLSQRLAP